MSIRHRGLAIGMVLLLVSACGGRTPTPPASPSTTPSGAPALPSLALRPTPAPTPSATPAARDLAIYALPQADDLLRGAAVASMASAPAGVVILGNDRATGALASWTSSDGDGWSRHWLPGGTFGGGTPDLLVGAPFGYLALGWRTDQVPRAFVEGISFPRALWSSPDGVAWAPAYESGLPAGEVTALVSGPVGVAALITIDGNHAAVGVTRDGRTWQSTTLRDGDVPFDKGLVATPDGFVLTGSIEAFDAQGRMTQTPAAWRSSDGLAWTSDTNLAKELTSRDNSIDSWQLSPAGAVGWSSYVGGTGPALLTASGMQEIAPPETPTWSGHAAAGPAGLVWVFGVDATASCVSAWQYDGGRWRPLDGTTPDDTCLDGETPNVLAAAALPDGMVMVGMVASSGDRVAWLIRHAHHPPTGSAAGGEPATPPATSIPDALAIAIPTPATCPALPTAIAAVFDLDPAAAASCFGDRTMSFRAWVKDPGEGYGGTCGSFTPAWIRECVLPDYLLTAGRTSSTDDAKVLHAMRSPDATGDLKGVGRWVRVKGHFDDPASPTCRAGGSDEAAYGLESEVPRGLVVAACRLVFVVTDVRTVS